MVRALFLDPDVLLCPKRVAANWVSYGNYNMQEDMARQVFEHAIDDAAIARLNAVVEKTDAVIVIASHWLHVWTLGDIASMLQARGFRGTKFSAIHVYKDKSALSRIGAWLDTVRDCGKTIGGYAVWAGHPLAGYEHDVHRTVALLTGEAAS